MRRAAAPPPIPPEFYTPPTIHPEVTRRTDQHAKHEQVIPSPTGKLPFLYGHVRTAGQILWFWTSLSYFTGGPASGTDFWYVVGLGRGECDALLQPWLNDAPASTSAPNYNTYFHPGSQTQGIDTLGVVSGGVWDETLPGVCYVVVQLINVGVNWTSVPNFQFELRGRKVLDPRTGVTAYSENTVLQFYDWLRDPEGKALWPNRINVSQISAAATIADETLGAGKRYASHVMIDSGSPEDWVKTWMLLCDGTWSYLANQWNLQIDRAGSVVATYDDSHILLDPAPEGSREPPDQRINEVIIEHMDPVKWTLVAPPLSLATAAVTNGTEDKRTATYRLPWLHDTSIVKTKLVYLLNKHQFDAKLKVAHKPSTVARSVGDIIVQSVAARGIGAQTWRIASRERDPETNCYLDVLTEYNTAAYGDVVASAAASRIASVLPDITSPPPEVQLFTSSSITEELYQEKVGSYQPRARLTWRNPDYAWIAEVELSISIAGGEYRFVKGYPGTASQTMVALVDQVMELTAYSFKLVVRGLYSGRSTGVVVSKTFAGKVTPPTDVPALLPSPMHGRMRVFAQPATDLDIIRYEWRYGTTSDTWSTARIIDAASGLLLDVELPYSDNQPGGVWRIFCKAVDSGKNYSTNATYVDVVVANAGPALGRTNIPISVTTHAARYNDLAVMTTFPGMIIEGAFGVSSRQSVTAMLVRSLSPAQIDSEIAAAGFTSLAQWDAANPFGLWAPLPLTSGMMSASFFNGGGFTFGTSRRNLEARVSFVSPQRIGNQSPDLVCRVDASYGGQTGDVVRSAAAGMSNATGFKLATNNAYAQNVVIQPAGGSTWSVTEDRVVVVLDGIDLTTDGSGVASRTFPRPMGAAQVPDITATVNGTTAALVLVTAKSETGYSIKVVNPSTFAVMSGVVVSCVARDLGAGGSIGLFTV
ncbi:MAG: hypothetical protein JWO56_3758 [Acidobacteria bacterium]|nr:hypothetical protein [Acidobacteriota bacterium]